MNNTNFSKTLGKTLGKTRIALAVLLTAFALAPATAAKPKKAAAGSASHQVAKAGKHAAASQARTSKPSKASKLAAGKNHKGAKAAPVALAAAAAAAAAPERPAAVVVTTTAGEKRSDRTLDYTAQQFLNGLWKLDPEAAISVGKFDGAAAMSIPNPALRAAQLSFADDWLARVRALVDWLVANLENLSAERP